MNKKEKMLLKKYLGSIMICLCSFIPAEKIELLVENTDTIPELLKKISVFLKEKEVTGWTGEDLNEEQLNVLTIISELYLKKNRSKYKAIEKPSEIIDWFSDLIKNSLFKSELNIKNLSNLKCEVS